MKAAVLVEKGNLVVQEVPAPVPGQGQVLVKVICCGICGTDLHLFDMESTPHGVVMGHEWVGTVAGLGPDADAWQIGDRVVLGSYGLAGAAMAKMAGTLAADPLAFFSAHPAVRAGGYGQYLVWDADALQRVPDGVSDQDAAMTDTFSVALGSVMDANVKKGDTVLVIGAGPIGLAVLMCLRLQEPGRIFMTEINEIRTKMAQSLGADLVLDPREPQTNEILRSLNGSGPDVIIDCVGSPQTIQQSVDWIRFGGRVVLVGITTRSVVISPLQWIGKGLCYRVYSHGPVGQVLELFHKRNIDPGRLITGRVPLGEIQSAFLELKRPTDQIKTLVYPE